MKFKKLYLLIIVFCVCLICNLSIPFTSATVADKNCLFEAERSLEELSFIDTVKINQCDPKAVSVYFTLFSKASSLDLVQESQMREIVSKALHIDPDVPVFKCITGSPTVTQLVQFDGISKTLVDTAYLDIETASPEMKLEILEARKVVINNTEWVADGLDGWVENVKTGEIIRRIPNFSELFPGWEIPISDELDLGAIPQLSLTDPTKNHN